MTTAVDEARDVREEDKLDAGRVDAFLRQHVPGLQGTPAIRQFPGGASNLTYRHVQRLKVALATGGTILSLVKQARPPRVRERDPRQLDIKDFLPSEK